MEKYKAELKNKIKIENEYINNLNKKIRILESKKNDIHSKQIMINIEYNKNLNLSLNEIKSELEFNKKLLKYLKKAEFVLSTLTMSSVFLFNQTFISLILIGTTGFSIVKYNNLKNDNNKLKKLEEQKKDELYIRRNNKNNLIDEEIKQLQKEKNEYMSQIKLLNEEKDNRNSKKNIYKLKLDIINNKELKPINKEPAKIIQFKK